MSYQVFVDGDGEQYWTGHNTLPEAYARFIVESEPGSARRVSLVWEDFDYEPE